MIQKLTANLRKSEQYGKRIVQQLKQISNSLLYTKIEIAKLEQKIEQRLGKRQLINTNIKRQVQQFSNYEYKKQKLQIRLKQFNRKAVLQQQIYEKKIQHQDQTRSKIASIQNEIKKQNIYDDLIHKNKQQIGELDLKVNKQLITMQNLHHQLIIKNKKIRQKQDELIMKRKSIIKKKQTLISLNNTLINSSNKQNIDSNLTVERQQIIKNLQERNKQQNDKIEQKINTLLSIYTDLDSLLNQNSRIKNEVIKSGEVIQEAKLQKISLLKTKDMFLSKRAVSEL